MTIYIIVPAKRGGVYDYGKLLFETMKNNQVEVEFVEGFSKDFQKKKSNQQMLYF